MLLLQVKACADRDAAAVVEMSTRLGFLTGELLHNQHVHLDDPLQRSQIVLFTASEQAHSWRVHFVGLHQFSWTKICPELSASMHHHSKLQSHVAAGVISSSVLACQPSRLACLPSNTLPFLLQPPLGISDCCPTPTFSHSCQHFLHAALLPGDESKVMLDAHTEAGFVVGMPFAAPGVYDFGRHSGMTARVSELGSIMLKHRLTAPPE